MWCKTNGRPMKNRGYLSQDHGNKVKHEHHEILATMHMTIFTTTMFATDLSDDLFDPTTMFKTIFVDPVAIFKNRSTMLPRRKRIAKKISITIFGILTLPNTRERRRRHQKDEQLVMKIIAEVAEVTKHQTESSKIVLESDVQEQLDLIEELEEVQKKADIVARD